MAEIFQNIAERTHDVVTPANAMSAAGFALAVTGASRMETLEGTLVMGAGRVLDILDGKVARATGTASALGEMVDATFDKAAVAIMCYQGVRKEILPKTVVASIAVQNAANAAMTLADRQMHPDDPHIHPSIDGKHTMFAQNASIGLFCLSEVSKPPVLKSGLRALGWVAAGVATIKGIRATRGYYNELTSD